jgi:hypothetical protein
MRDVVTGWALARLGAGGSKSKLDPVATLDELQKRFALDARGRELLALVWAAERSLEVAKRAREAMGAFTVAVAADALGQPLDDLLAQGAPLRRHALVTLDTAGPALATSVLKLGAAVGPRLDGTPLPLDEFAPGVRAFQDATDRFPAGAKVAELVKERIVSLEALFATIDGCPRREALALGAAAAKRFSRPLVTVDGEVLAGLRESWELLAAVRREADLEGAVLLVVQAAALGEGWRALMAPPPAQPLRPVLIIVADALRTREVTLVDGLRHQPLVLNGVTAVEKAPEPAKEDPYEQIRRQAQRDADKAMGIYRPEPSIPVAAAPPLEPARVEPPKVEAKPEPARVEPPKVEAKPEPAKAEPPKVEAKPEAPKVEAAAEEKPKKRRSKKAMEHFGADPADAPAPEAKIEAKPEAKVEAPQEAKSEPAADEAEKLNPNAPFLPVPDKATPDQLAMIARTSKNPQQRLEILEAIKGVKNPQVVLAMRDNARSADPKIRLLAETVMASFFGPNWNRTRPVPKPVQPPQSEDKNPNRPW